jgi:hypothetical protein
MSLDPNALLIAKRMQAAGYTRGQIAGALGNFQLESGFNPRINEGGKVGAPLGDGGYGVGQWTADRQTNLINFAKGKKLDPGSIEAQADFLIHELDGPEKRAGQSLRGAVSPEEAARRFVVDYERAGVPKTEARQKAARAIYEKLGAFDQTQGATTGQETSSTGFLQGFLSAMEGSKPKDVSVAALMKEGLMRELLTPAQPLAMNPFQMLLNMNPYG